MTNPSRTAAQIQSILETTRIAYSRQVYLSIHTGDDGTFRVISAGRDKTVFPINPKNAKMVHNDASGSLRWRSHGAPFTDYQLARRVITELCAFYDRQWWSEELFCAATGYRAKPLGKMFLASRNAPADAVQRANPDFVSVTGALRGMSDEAGAILLELVPIYGTDVTGQVDISSAKRIAAVDVIAQQNRGSRRKHCQDGASQHFASARHELHRVATMTREALAADAEVSSLMADADASTRAAIDAYLAAIDSDQPLLFA